MSRRKKIIDWEKKAQKHLFGELKTYIFFSSVLGYTATATRFLLDIKMCLFMNLKIDSCWIVTPKL
jgi:hypothetical protein